MAHSLEMTDAQRGPAADRAEKTTALAEGATAKLVALAVLAAAAFALLFHHWFYTQARLSATRIDDWGHAFIIPLISAYILWRERRELARIGVAPFWPGALPFFLGILCYVYFLTGLPNHMLQGWSLVLCLWGMALLLLGPGMIRSLTFPIAYLLFAVTISEMIMIRGTFVLQQVAAFGAHTLLSIIGAVGDFSADLAGNQITITTAAGENLPLNVAQACSGMRMVVAFYALGAAVAYLNCPHWWQRAALLILAGPIAIFVNVLRVTSLGMVSFIDPELASGDTHKAIGVLWLLPALALFMGTVWLLNRVVTAAPTAGSAAP